MTALRISVEPSWLLLTQPLVWRIISPTIGRITRAILRRFTCTASREISATAIASHVAWSIICWAKRSQRPTTLASRIIKTNPSQCKLTSHKVVWATIETETTWSIDSHMLHLMIILRIMRGWRLRNKASPRWTIMMTKIRWILILKVLKFKITS